MSVYPAAKPGHKAAHLITLHCASRYRPCRCVVVREDLVYAVPNTGNKDMLLNEDEMTACVVLFERREVRVTNSWGGH